MKKSSLFRFLPTFGADRVDRVQNVIYGVSMAQLGPCMGHDMMFDSVTLDQIVEMAVSKNGLKSRFTHPGLSADGLGSFLGRVKNPCRIGDKATGDLFLSEIAFMSPRGDLGSYVLGLAEKDPDAFGMSIVCYLACTVWVMEDGREVVRYDYEKQQAGELKRPSGARNELPAARLSSLRAVDLVDEPAANRDGLFEVGGGFDLWDGRGEVAERYFEEIDLCLSRANVDYERAFQFALSYFLARGVTLSAVYTQPEGDSMGNNSPVQMDQPVVNAPAVPPADPVLFSWQHAQIRATVQVILNASGLPEMVRRRLSTVAYQTPEELERAIEAERAYLAELQALSSVDIPGTPPRGAVSVGDGPLDRFKNAIDWIFGVSGSKTPSPEYRKLDLLYVAMTGDVNMTGRFDRALAFAASPVTLPDLAVDAMNKIVTAQFSKLAKWRWYEKIVKVVPNDGTLHDPKWITFGGTGNLPIVADGAAYTEANIADAKESDPFEKRGVYVGITRKMIKNSDIMRLRAIPVALATDAVRTRSNKVASIFTVNSGVGPTLDDDSTALFHATHANVGTTAFSITEWRVIAAECFGHTELGSGKAIGVFPKYGLFPDDLYFTALAAFGYGVGYPTSFLPEGVELGPDDPRPVPLVVPDWTDANDYAYITDPNEFPVIEMTYSQNPGGETHPEPELFTVMDETAGLTFTNDQIPIKVRDEFAVGPNGANGIGKRNVA